MESSIMDSKYTAYGADSRAKVNARKGTNDNLQVKKPKLYKETDKKPYINGHVNQNGIESEIQIKETFTENLQEARKRLPVYGARGRLLEEIRKNNTMILIGETGSGKTTQVPQLIHEQRLEGTNAIAITQPRRVAAITIALRVAAEMNTKIGTIVGYSVRFEDVTSPKTKLKYLTDGMLLREAVVDPLLRKYSIVILDEAHERTVNTDVLFGIVKLAQKERNTTKLHPLKVIIMSATMDVDLFRNYFDNCPVIYLEGRTYPVTIYHSKMKQEDYPYATVCTIFQLHETMPANHDFLVFLTGQEEIESVMYKIKQIAKDILGPQMKVCPLYAGLPPAKQLQVWKATPPGTRKIVLATNIAEASVTIPQIKCVIDSGVVKERTWCLRTGAERLQVAACAQAAAWQRAGRAGRTAPGAAYRLYTAADLAARPQHTTPEILRCPLASTILLLIAAGIEPTNFPLLDSPPQESIKASLALLKELGAIDNEDNPKLTPLGKKMASFPIDPKYSKILLSAPDYNCLDEALSLVALLSSESVFHTPMHKRHEALKAKQKFISPLGDHITLLNVFKAFCSATLKKQWCNQNYLNHRNLSYAYEVRQQLLFLTQRLNLAVSSCGTDLDQVLKCLLSGLFTNCAWVRTAGTITAGNSGGRYVTAGGVAVTVHPTSVLYSTRPPPPNLLYTELLHTRRHYMLTVSTIQPHWLNQAAPEYARRCRANRTWCLRTGAERLQVATCAQAAAWQRAGRAGRTAPGAAYRLYTAADLAARPQHTTPEILRCPLASTILLLIAAGIEPTNFPLLDSPPQESIKASLALLKELGAIDNEDNPKLTPLGKKMASFPIDPKYSKILLSAPDYNCLDEALSLVALLSSESVFHTPMHKRHEALKAKQKFISPLGDHITLLNVFKAFCSATLKKQWCNQNYLNHRNLSYAYEVRQQLLFLTQRLNLAVSSCGTDLDQVLKCLLSGLFTNCAWVRTAGTITAGNSGGRYVTAGGVAVTVHPTSVLYSTRPPPPNLLYTELLHTRRHYMLTVSTIQPHWLNQAAPEYARRCRANR